MLNTNRFLFCSLHPNPIEILKTILLLICVFVSCAVSFKFRNNFIILFEKILRFFQKKLLLVSHDRIWIKYKNSCLNVADEINEKFFRKLIDFEETKKSNKNKIQTFAQFEISATNFLYIEDIKCVFI